jgi:hypothetical protein
MGSPDSLESLIEREAIAPRFGDSGTGRLNGFPGAPFPKRSSSRENPVRVLVALGSRLNGVRWSHCNGTYFGA